MTEDNTPVTADNAGRPYALMSQLQPGAKVQVDADFTCIRKNAVREVMKDDGGLYIPCRHGKHHLDGQLDGQNHDSLIGVYEAA